MKRCKWFHAFSKSISTKWMQVTLAGIWTWPISSFFIPTLLPYFILVFKKEGKNIMQCVRKKNTYKKHIIIIMSRRQRGYPWPSLATSPYHSSPPAGLQGYILCPHIVAVCMFVLVVPLLHIHMWGSTGVHRLWARPCFSSSVLRTCE